MAANTIEYGLKNFTVFPITKSGNSTTAPTYGSGIKLGGAIELSLAPEQSTESLTADNVIVAKKTITKGFTGTVKVSDLSDDILKALFGYTTTTNGSLEFKLSTGSKEFALSFEVELQSGKTKRVQILRCVATLPGVNHETSSDSAGFATKELNITAFAREDLGNTIYMFTMIEPDSSATSQVKAEWAKYFTGVIK